MADHDLFQFTTNSGRLRLAWDEEPKNVQLFELDKLSKPVGLGFIAPDKVLLARLLYILLN